MPETDVEKTLREIRDRVRVQLRQQSLSPTTPASTAEQSGANGPAIESIKANLSVVERARTRLPPITSYRKGLVAKVELWIKRLLRRASHWFTWEQVNFNSATSNSLKDVLGVLSSHEEVLMELQSQLEKIASATTRLQEELHTLAANGHQKGNYFNEYQPVRAIGAAATAPEDNSAYACENQTKIDSEIDLLAARLEELRAIKERLDSLG